MKAENLLSGIPAELAEELVTTLLSAAGLRIEAHRFPRPGLSAGVLVRSARGRVGGGPGRECRGAIRGRPRACGTRARVIPEHPGPRPAPCRPDRPEAKDHLAGNSLRRLNRDRALRAASAAIGRGRWARDGRLRWRRKFIPSAKQQHRVGKDEHRQRGAIRPIDSPVDDRLEFFAYFLRVLVAGEHGLERFRWQSGRNETHKPVGKHAVRTGDFILEEEPVGVHVVAGNALARSIADAAAGLVQRDVAVPSS